MIALLILVILLFLFSTLDFCLAREGNTLFYVNIFTSLNSSGWFLLDIKEFDQGVKLLGKCT